MSSRNATVSKKYRKQSHLEHIKTKRVTENRLSVATDLDVRTSLL